MTNYVAGFLFSPDLKRVALIRKNKPEWQKGKLNGVGGKVEPGETFYEAMVREFEEETGRPSGGWRGFASLGKEGERDPFRVYFFSLVAPYALESKTDELVGWYPVAKLAKLPVISNLRWLIPLALEDSTFYAKAEAA